MAGVISLASSEWADDSGVRERYDLNEVTFKILVIGDYGVGKTAIIRRYTKGLFSENYKITIGVDFALKKIRWDANTSLILQLWDIAGHERFGYMTRIYYQYATAAIIVFDLSRLVTLDSVVKWYRDVNEKVTQSNGQPIPVILLANKCDLSGVTVKCQSLHQFCKQNNILAWFFTSAKENVSISEAFYYLAEKIFYMNKERENGSAIISNPTIKLTPTERVKKKKKCC